MILGPDISNFHPGTGTAPTSLGYRYVGEGGDSGWAFEIREAVGEAAPTAAHRRYIRLTCTPCRRRWRVSYALSRRSTQPLKWGGPRACCCAPLRFKCRAADSVAASTVSPPTSHFTRTHNKCSSDMHPPGTSKQYVNINFIRLPY